jgi:hypothetical protein
MKENETICGTCKKQEDCPKFDMVKKVGAEMAICSTYDAKLVHKVEEKPIEKK